MFSRLDVPGISGDEDAAALAASVWLADVRARLALTAEGLEIPIAVSREAGQRVPALCSRPRGPWQPSASDLLSSHRLKLSFPFHPDTFKGPGPSLEGAEKVEPACPHAPGSPLTHSAGRHQVRGKMLYSPG